VLGRSPPGGRDKRARAAAARGAIPWPLTIPALLAALFLLVPLAGLLVRAPWVGLPGILGRLLDEWTGITLPFTTALPDPCHLYPTRRGHGRRQDDTGRRRTADYLLDPSPERL